MMKYFSKEDVRKIIQDAFNFIDNGKVVWKDMAFLGHPGFYFFHTKKELEQKIESQLVKDKYNQYDLCYIMNSLIKFMLSKYDSHTRILFSEGRYLPIELKIVDNEVYIINVSSKFNKFKAWKVLEINGVIVSKLLNEIEEICCYSTEEYLRTRQVSILEDIDMLRTLPSIDSTTFEFDFLVSDGENSEVISFDINNLVDEVEASFLPENYSYELVNDCVVIHYNACRDKDKMEELIKKISTIHSDKYIIDLRYNGGGDSSIIRPLIEFLKGKMVVVLINEYVFSSGRMALVELKKIGAYVIGTNISTSLNAFGNNPSEYRMDGTDLIVKKSSNYFLYDSEYNCESFSKNNFFEYFKDKTALLEPVFISPDLEVKETVDDIVAGRDIQMKMAFQYLEEKFNGKSSV